jgi:3,4-dihydroxy 2-butanone 4-phosphate synthase/GTP cyclohydrolase II
MMQADAKIQSKTSGNSVLMPDGMTESHQSSQEPIKSIDDLKIRLSKAKAFRIQNNRPFITISYAQSVDGSIASKTREQIHLSGPQSSMLTHQIRASCDAILIGIGTLLADDPCLTVRLVEGNSPQPIILDTRLRTPADAKLVKRTDRSPWIINGKENRNKHSLALKTAGAMPLPCATGEDGKIDLFALMRILAEMEVNSLMVEGGARVITSFINSKLVDHFIITMSPRLVGGLPVIDSNEIKSESYLRLAQVNYQHLGDDLIIWAKPVWGDNETHLRNIQKSL